MFLSLIGALAIGLTLGILGSGGSILTVPVLTYLVGLEDKVAIASSLAIVGAISLVAAIPQARRGLVDARSVMFFGLPGMAGAYLGADLSRYVSGTTQLSVLAALMLLAAVLMLRPVKPKTSTKTQAAWMISLEGAIIGVLTGFVGVGGGFLIVPSLVFLGGLSMQRAVATSLVIIALKSAMGFVKYVDVLNDLDLSLDLRVLVLFSAIGILGSLSGTKVGAMVSQRALRQSFAGLLVVIGGLLVVL